MAVKSTPGMELVDRIRADMDANGLEPDGREVELLDQARSLADRIAQLEACIAIDGLRVTLNSGRVVLHPAVTEVRQHRAALARVLSGIQMEDDTKDPVKQNAARSRWRRHNAAKVQAQNVVG